MGGTESERDSQSGRKKLTLIIIFYVSIYYFDLTVYFIYKETPFVYIGGGGGGGRGGSERARLMLLIKKKTGDEGTRQDFSALGSWYFKQEGAGLILCLCKKCQEGGMIAYR